MAAIAIDLSAGCGGMFGRYWVMAYLDTLPQPGWAFLGVGQQIYICVMLFIPGLVIGMAQGILVSEVTFAIAVRSYRGLLRLRSKTNLTAHVDL